MSPGPPDHARARTATPGRPPSLAPFACHAALLCGALAIASVTAAVPAVATDLGMDPVRTQWFASAYQLTCGPLQLGVSHFADRYGARRVLLVALAVFAVASLLATAAATPAVVIAARLVQGVGGAALSPVSLALLLTLRGGTDSEPHAVAGWVSTAAAASCLGPVLGGLLTGLMGWRAVFGALTLLATASAVCTLHAPGGRPPPTPPRHAADVVGITLCTAAAVAALITLTAPAATASPPARAVIGLLTATLTGLLVLRTRRAPRSAVDAGLLRQAATRRALLVLPALFAANSAFTFLTYFTLTRSYGLSPLPAALVALPAAAPAVLTARLAARRTGEHRDGAPLMRTGLMCLAAGMLISGCGQWHPTPLWLISGACAFVGSGLGLANGSAMTVLSCGRTSHRTAQGVAAATTCAMLGGAAGPPAAGAALALVGHPPRACGASTCDALGTPPGAPLALTVLGLLTAAVAVALTARRLHPVAHV